MFVKERVPGRETAIRSLQAAGLEVGTISDVTPQPPQNGSVRQAASGLAGKGGTEKHGSLYRPRNQEVSSSLASI